MIKKTCEGNWSTKWNIEEYTPTNVWVNNREVHPIDIDHFKRLRLPITSVEEGSPAAFWIIDENGEVYPEPDMSRGYIEDLNTRSTVKVSISQPKWVVFSEVNNPDSKRDRLKRSFSKLRSIASQQPAGYFVYPIQVQCGENVVSTECQFSQLQEFQTFVCATPLVLCITNGV